MAYIQYIYIEYVFMTENPHHSWNKSSSSRGDVSSYESWFTASPLTDKNR